MAGVRGDDAPIVEPKGIPDDMSLITKLDYERWGADAHTPSWFNEEEIDKLTKWLKQMGEIDNNNNYLDYTLEWGILGKAYMFGNRLTAFKHYDDCNYIPKICDAVRIVFWFDN